MTRNEFIKQFTITHYYTYGPEEVITKARLAWLALKEMGHTEEKDSGKYNLIPMTEACKILGIGANTMLKHCVNQTFEFKKKGRSVYFWKEEIEKYAKESETMPLEKAR